jgi:hypothetical protein
MRPSPQRLERLLGLAGRAPDQPPGPPSAALEAAVLRAWRRRDDSGADAEATLAVFRRATLAALAVCAACALWALPADPSSPSTADAAPELPAGLAAYALNFPLPP